jgi:ATP/maltotriose-dependent transcriptional regulator MalT
MRQAQNKARRHESSFLHVWKIRKSSFLSLLGRVASLLVYGKRQRERKNSRYPIAVLLMSNYLLISHYRLPLEREEVLDCVTLLHSNRPSRVLVLRSVGSVHVCLARKAIKGANNRCYPPMHKAKRLNTQHLHPLARRIINNLSQRYARPCAFISSTRRPSNLLLRCKAS